MSAVESAVAASTSTDIAVLPIPQRVALLLKSADTEKELQALVLKHKDIVEVTNKDGREQVHAAYMVLKNRRIQIEKLGKEVRDEAVRFSKATNAEEARLVALISPEEDRLQALRDAWDNAREAERQEVIRKDRERIAAIDAEVEDIRGLPLLAAGKEASHIEAMIQVLADDPIDEAVFMERAEVANKVRDGVLERLRAMHAERVTFEAQQAELVEQKRLHDEQVERDRLAAEQRQREQDERDRLAREERAREEMRQRELAELDRQRRARIDAIRQQSVIAAVGTTNRKGGTLKCAEDTLLETQNLPVTLELFGTLIGEAQTAKDLALVQIGGLVEQRREEAAAAERRQQEEKRLADEREALRKQQEAQAAAQRKLDQDRESDRLIAQITELRKDGLAAQGIDDAIGVLSVLGDLSISTETCGDAVGEVQDLANSAATAVQLHIADLRATAQAAAVLAAPVATTTTDSYPGAEAFENGICAYFGIDDDTARAWLHHWSANAAI